MTDSQSAADFAEDTLLPVDAIESTEDVLDRMLEVALQLFMQSAPVDQPSDLLLALPSTMRVPTEQDPAQLVSSRSFVLFELLKLDMALAAEQGLRVANIDWYQTLLQTFALGDAIPLDVVLEELQLRSEYHQPIDALSYHNRFPHLIECLPALPSAGSPSGNMRGGMPSDRSGDSPGDGARSVDDEPVNSGGQRAGVRGGVLCFDAEATRARRQQSPPQSLSAGTEIDDFLIIRALGRGAFAHVYLAQQVSMQRLVALKISRGGLDESQTLARLDHQGIVRVFDQRRVQLPAGDGDGHLLYMQYVPGGTLSDIVSAAASCEPRHRNGHLVLDCVDQNLLRSAQQVPERSRVRLWLSSASWPTVVAWMGIQLARALHVAHQTGILHRDVKPANVLISAEGMPRLADFNVSFAGAAGRSGAAASFGGSIGYMSPEHLAAVSLISGVPPESKVANSLNADCVGQPADLYSLAVLLWELWQGRRPFDCNATPNSWTDAIVDQSQSRARSYLPNPIETTVDAGDAASERVLEQTLRQTLSLHVQQRPADGRALAGRLRLVLFPAAAKIFDIPDRGIRRWIANLTPWIVTTTLILTPNIAAGVFNWFYNFTQIIGNHPEMADGFQTLSNCVNAIFFPLGGFLIVWLSRDFSRALGEIRGTDASRAGAIESAKGAASDGVDGADASGDDVSRQWRDSTQQMLRIPARAAWVGGSLWCVAAIIYPATLLMWYPTFPISQAIHFFASLVVCGGVAAAYPYFALLLVVTHVYYPMLVRIRMVDAQFRRRANNIRELSSTIMLGAAGIPLIAIAMLLSRETIARQIMIAAVVASAIGLLGAWWVYRRVTETWDQMAPVLDIDSDSEFAGKDEGNGSVHQQMEPPGID